MQGLIHWYNVNRKMIWTIIGTIVVVFLAVQLISRIVNNVNNEKLSKIAVDTRTNTVEKYNTVALDTEESVVSGNKLSNTQKEGVSVIDSFIEYCNSGDVKNAYNLLSDDCKSQLYPNINVFNKTYYSKIFTNGKKNIAIENWVNNIYKVRFEKDLLSAGEYDKSGTIQDYITVVKDENKESKLNINGYIGKDKIDRERTDRNITIKVIERQKYMDYEIYTFIIDNKNHKDITLADKKEINQIYLEDENGVQYVAQLNELAEEQLDVFSGETKKLNIKFFNKYVSSKKIKKVYFSNIMYDYRQNTDYKPVFIEI